jgi:hypothetical protein
MRLRVVAVLAVAAMAGSTIGWTRHDEGRKPFEVRVARIMTGLDARGGESLVRSAALMGADAAAPNKAVSRNDKNTFTFIGSVLDWDFDFLSDGTPVTVLVMRVNTPLAQETFVTCIGNFAYTCAGTGRRQFDGFLFAGDGDAFDEFLFLAVATKMKR